MPARLLARPFRLIEDRLSLRQQIAVGTALLCLALVGFVAIGAAWISRQQTTHLVENEVQSLAGFVSQRLDAAMAGRLRELSFLTSAEPMLVRWRAETPVVRRLLDEIMKARPDFDWMALVRPDGVIRASSNGASEGESVNNVEWFRQGLQGPTVIDAGQANKPESAPGKDADLTSRADPFDLIRIAYPVRERNGLLVGVLAVHLRKDWPGEMMRGAVQPAMNAATTQLWVLGRDGAVVAGDETGRRPYSDEKLADMRSERHGAFLDETLPGPALAGFSVTQSGEKGPGWIVVARKPLQVAAGAWQSIVNSILLLGGFLAVLGIVMATVLSGRIVRPIRGLIADADRIGRDSSVTMIGRHGGSREVVDLSAALRSLLRRLGSAEERTLLIEQHAAEESRRLTADVDLLRNLAEADPMTGLSNRRAFAASTAEAMAEFDVGGVPLALLVIDIDHFKRVNDQYGHAAGDVVLRQVAVTLKQAAGPGDSVSRYGGEEFVILMHDAGREQARTMAERIRATIAAAPMSVGATDIRVTASIGLTVAHAADRDFEDLFHRADLALYTAKRNGRNQVQESIREQDGVHAAA